MPETIEINDGSGSQNTDQLGMEDAGREQMKGIASAVLYHRVGSKCIIGAAYYGVLCVIGCQQIETPPFGAAAVGQETGDALCIRGCFFQRGALYCLNR